MKPDYRVLATEREHPRARMLHQLSTEHIVALLVAEEARAVRAVAGQRAAIARAAELIASSLDGGGRLIYVGAGTSGRLGALDAAELPPTFGSDPRRAVAVLAGGTRALRRAVEGAEDRPVDAHRALARLGVGAPDVVCAVAASGVTPFTRAALVAARRKGARTIFVTFSPDPAHAAMADVVVAAEVGPEVVAGSTRLKAGTATKIVLNALSTAAMVRLGKVWRGRMVDLVATNAKLRARAVRIVEELGEVTPRRAAALLARSRGHVKPALAAALLGVSVEEAAARLAAAGGRLAALVED